MRQTGGLAVGDISTKSNPSSSAARRASLVDTIPAWLPSTSIKRTSGTVICSLIRARSFSRLVGALMVYSSSSLFIEIPYGQFLASRYHKLYLLSSRPNRRLHGYVQLLDLFRPLCRL